MAVQCGRDNGSIPKKLGSEFVIRRNNDHVTAQVCRRGTELVNIDLKIGEYNNAMTGMLYQFPEAGKKTYGGGFYFHLDREPDKEGKSHLWAGGGVCGAIFKEAGYNELTDACTKIGHCDTGNAVITPGFQLKAKYIIHAVGPQWHGGSHNKEHLLRKCYQTALLLARDNGCKSIGFPLISSGIYGYPKKEHIF